MSAESYILFSLIKSKQLPTLKNNKCLKSNFKLKNNINKIIMYNCIM